jgi:hypothetical protein
VAGLTLRPARLIRVCFRSAGCAVGRNAGVVTPGSCPGRGSLPGPAGAVRPSPQEWRASGAAGLRQRTWRLGSTGCRPPRPGRLRCQSSPRSAASPPRWYRVGVRVGLLVPKATEGLFKLEAWSARAARAAGGGGEVVGFPCVRVNSAARACPAESSKATAVSKHPAAANRTFAFWHVP